ncbi:aspartic peptidase [Gramella sp. GC03-9]|uniref:Aspartic peptidase n=1 Tax=Christiangramia oceanisediminis TaxID=2920386 RepID=A0A9X2RBF7_9FLAO|nr:aspartic peptidase [Gramella oceanisediminis]MCP9201024.1 aspartic peptidase [Gramella oceanisediminis]
MVFTLITTSYNAQINQLDDDGRRNGPWKVNFEGTDEPKFEGNFENGKEVGIFKFYKKGFYDHPAAIMDFGKGQDSVKVTYYTQKGEPISEGRMLDRKREGKWVYYHQNSDSIMMIENYKNDLLNGLQETYYPNGQLAEKTSYLEGKKHGESLIYTEKGQLTKQLRYRNGELHGPAIYFDPKGLKQMEGQYVEGKKSGTWKYYTDGKFDREENH